MTYFLHTGEVLFSKEPCTVTTILGSCVGVAIHDPVLRIGGLCHYLLPDSPANSPASTRYGDVALPYLIQRLLKAGSQKKDLRAWVSGGALLLEAHEIFFVGDRNADFAEKLLGDWGIRVVANDTRGFRGRKVVFHTHEGQFHCQALSTKAERALMVI